MPAIVGFPTVVNEAIRRYGSLFQNEPERVHFGEYVTGLVVAERKTVVGINREFARTTDQSCLNRWITEVEWDEQEMNRRRLEEHQKDPETRYAEQGVIALDNVLVDHEGELIEDVGYFWDHAEERYKIAHDLLIWNYVCTSGKHYPLDFLRFRKKQQCEAKKERFRSHTDLCLEAIGWVVRHRIPGTFSFDSYFTNAPIMHRIADSGRKYVGDLKFNRKVGYRGKTTRVSKLAEGINPEDRKLLEVGGRRQWYFSVVVRMSEVRHPVRILILWKHKKDREPAKILVTNCLHWEATRIVRVYRKRWTGTETFHRDGKQHLGLGDCQLREGRGHDRHLYLLFVTYSLLVSQMGQGRAREWARVRLQTVGEACRAVLREVIGATLQWAFDRAEEGYDLAWVKAELGLMGGST